MLPRAVPDVGLSLPGGIRVLLQEGSLGGRPECQAREPMGRPCRGAPPPRALPRTCPADSVGNGLKLLPHGHVPSYETHEISP